MNYYWGRVYLCCYPMHPCLIGPLDCVNKADVALRSTMRRLWGEHVAWTRAAISSLVYSIPDADVVITRLLRTALDMGNALRPFYGNTIANQYGQLLTEHITLKRDLINATVVGNIEKASRIEERWFKNGTEITLFLKSVNPYLSAVDFQEMLDEHFVLFLQATMSMINKDYKASVDLFHLMEIDVLEIADTLVDAIIKQYPYKFMSMYG